MEELASLEKHLLQAKAKALAEEEKTLSERKEALGAYESVSLPSGTYTVLQQSITCVHVHVHLELVVVYIAKLVSLPLL